MSTPSSESLLSQWFRRVWNESDASAIEEPGAPDLISHGLVADIHGRENWRKQFYEPMQAAVGRTLVRIIAEVAQGDTIIARGEAVLTMRGTGQEVVMPGFCQMRIAGGKIAEAWDVWDFAGVMERLRLLPPGSFGAAVSGQLAAHPAA